MIKKIEDNLRCPKDQGVIERKKNGYWCTVCNYQFKLVPSFKDIIPDFRMFDIETTYSVQFTIPSQPLQEKDILNYSKATKSDYSSYSRNEIRKIFKTKLHREMLYYINKVKSDSGSDLLVLDLGCGKGGNRKYLNSVGIEYVYCVDYKPTKATHALVDVHRLPFADNSFDLILTTSTIEHFVNPYVAFIEMSRVLKESAALIASGSFWESWHAHSNFHFTPGGFYQLCKESNFELKDIWSNWGFIPAIATHAFGLGKYKRQTYKIQEWYDRWSVKRMGVKQTEIDNMRTSGSYGIYAISAKK